jgi:hypothetical protein
MDVLLRDDTKQADAEPSVVHNLVDQILVQFLSNGNLELPLMDTFHGGIHTVPPSPRGQTSWPAPG